MIKGLFRILDANLNRSREGLRVCEDISRFALESRRLSMKLKSIRHGIQETSKSLTTGKGRLLKARDAKGDVLRTSFLATEKRRSGLNDIFGANMQRVKESLRVLEEFSKLVDAEAARKFQELRFKTYDAEKTANECLFALRDTRRRHIKR